MLKDKLNNIISGYKINQDDADWLLCLLDKAEKADLNELINKATEEICQLALREQQ